MDACRLFRRGGVIEYHRVFSALSSPPKGRNHTGIDPVTIRTPTYVSPDYRDCDPRGTVYPI